MFVGRPQSHTSAYAHYTRANHTCVHRFYIRFMRLLQPPSSMPGSSLTLRRAANALSPPPPPHSTTVVCVVLLQTNGFLSAHVEERKCVLVHVLCPLWVPCFFFFFLFSCCCMRVCVSGAHNTSRDSLLPENIWVFHAGNRARASFYCLRRVCVKCWRKSCEEKNTSVAHKKHKKVTYYRMQKCYIRHVWVTCMQMYYVHNIL